MYLGRIITMLFLVSIPFNLFSQVLTRDKILRFEPHPIDETKFIAKFYDKESKNLIEHWEMSSSVNQFNRDHFNALLESKKIVPNGKCYFLYENRKKKLEVNYTQGVKTGDFIGFYENGEIRFKGTNQGALTGTLTHYFKNGSIKKEEKFEHGFKNKETILYSKSGDLISKTNYHNGAKNGLSIFYYKNGKEKRKQKYKMDELVSEKCFDESGKKTECLSLLIKPSYEQGIEALQTEIEEINFYIKNKISDTIICRLSLKIDTTGKAHLQRFNLNQKDTVSDMIMDWVSNLSKFNPMVINNSYVESNIHIAFPVCKNKALWLGEMKIMRRTIRNEFTQEETENFYWEFPIPKSNQVFFIVDNMPKFPGGGKALRKFIARNIKYPIEAQKKGIQGKVFVTFVIDSYGNPTKINVARKVHPLLDIEAKRIVKAMPKWEPGSHNDHPVPVSYTVPINFELRPKTGRRYSIETVTIRTEGGTREVIRK